MTRQNVTPPVKPYWRIIAELVAVLVGIISLGAIATNRSDVGTVSQPKRDVDAGPLEVSVPDSPATDPRSTPESDARLPQPLPAPEPDRAAIAQAESELSRARMERDEADRQAAEAQEALRTAELESAKAALAAKTLTERIRDPRARIASVQQRGAVLKTDVNRLRMELTSLAHAPRPRRKVLSDRTPVARVVEGKEYHFEVRGDRVAYINLESLVDRLEADARMQIRLNLGSSRPIRSTVGPVGSFSLAYELGQAPTDPLEGILGRSFSYDLVGWEIVPVRNVRGETLSAIRNPTSEFARVVNSLNPSRSTITLWIYPDGFGTYRQLLDVLHERGFQVAARPLPSGIAIRGSPNGSLSAGQ